MDNKTETLKFDLKEIYDYIGYAFKSDVLCIAAFIDPSFYGSEFRDKTDVNKKYHVKNRNWVLAQYGDLAIYGILGKLIGTYTYSKGSSIDKEYSFDYSVGKLTKIRNNLSEDKTFDQAIKRIGYDKYLIKGDTKIGKKTYANIFEGLVGAVAIDSNWNYNTILNVYKKLNVNYKDYLPKKEVKNLILQIK